MTRKYKSYTDEMLIEAAKDNLSLAGVLRQLDLRAAGGNYDSIRRKLSQLNVDTNHWTGQGWNKGQQLKDWGDYAQSALKAFLL